MYKWFISNMWPGPDLLQTVPTLVLNVDSGGDVVMSWFLGRVVCVVLVCVRVCVCVCFLLSLCQRMWEHIQSRVCVCACVCACVCLCLWLGLSHNMRNCECVCVFCVRVGVCLREPLWSCVEFLQTVTVLVLFDDLLLFNKDWLCTND